MVENDFLTGDIQSGLRMEHLSFTPMIHAWVPVLSRMGAIYHFPEPITTYMRAPLRRPAIYRWKIGDRDGTTAYYVGETENFLRRINHYRRGDQSQPTNKRIHDLFVNNILREAVVTLEFLQFEPFSIGDRHLTQASLADSHVRRFLEELFVVLMMANGDTLLNR